MNIKDYNRSSFQLFYKNFAHIAYIKKIYEQWAVHNSPFYIKYFILISVLIFAVCVPLDFLWFDSVEPYMNIRFIFIVCMLLLFVLYERVFNKNETHQKEYSPNYFLDF